MISTRFLAALLMFQTWLGYFPAVRSRNPRATFCGEPSTVSALVCNGNAVGMPALRWCVCALVAGNHCAYAGRFVGGIARAFHGPDTPIVGLWVPVRVSYRPVVDGLFQVWLFVSPGFCGKSNVLSPFAVTIESQKPGTLFDAPSVKSTMIRSPDWEPVGTDRISSHAR